jgi:hypothetical protein
MKMESGYCCHHHHTQSLTLAHPEYIYFPLAFSFWPGYKLFVLKTSLWPTPLMYVVSLKALLGPPSISYTFNAHVPNCSRVCWRNLCQTRATKDENKRVKSWLDPSYFHILSVCFCIIKKKSKNGIGIRSDVSGSTIENRKDYTSLIFTGSHIWTETSVFVNCRIIPTTNTLSQQPKSPPQPLPMSLSISPSAVANSIGLRACTTHRQGCPKAPRICHTDR